MVSFAAKRQSVGTQLIARGADLAGDLLFKFQVPKGVYPMFKGFVYLLGLISLLGSGGLAEDKTPYGFVAAGNSYNRGGGVVGWNTSTAYGHWLSDRYDIALNGEISWLTNTRANDTSLPRIWAGPYASSQEINLYESGNPTMSYSNRLTDKTKHWLYIYAKSYLEDTLSMSVESLVTHIADNSVTIVQNGDGSRTETGIQSLPFPKRRFTYQYWNNTSGDTAFYPAGYTWLANGYCPQTRAAIASAYYRAFISDPTAQGWPATEWDCYFMDNHARRLSFMAYWSLTSSSGGKNEGYLEWLENDTMLVRPNGGSNDAAAQQNYYDNSTVKIDSAIQGRLRSGGHDIKAFANVYSTWPNDLPPLLKHCAGVVFETFISYAVNWGNWVSLLASFDTLSHYPDNYSIFEYRSEFLCSETGWRVDTSRIAMAGYAVFLLGRTSKTFFCPSGVDQGDFGGDRRCWQDAYYVDLGEADSTWRKLDSSGTDAWSDKTMILYRSYGDNAVILRTGGSGVDFINDSQAVNLHGLFREIDGWTADTSLVADSIFYLRPYDGKTLVAGYLTVCDYPPSVPALSSPANGAAVTAAPTLCVSNAGHGSCPDPVTYRFEIAADQNFTSIVRQSGVVPQGSSTTCYTTGTPLDLGKRYYWHCRATNGTSTSQWSAASSFTSPNTPPPAVSGLSPTNGSTLPTARPVLAVTNVADPEGVPVTYTFEVSKFGNFSSLAAQSGQVSAGAGTTSWQVTTALENGSAYFWRARAYDGIAYGSWSTALSFTVSLPDTNHPPTAPVVYSPPDNATITYLPVSLTWYNATDADGDPLTYQVRLYDSAGTTALDSANGLAQGSGPTSSYSPQYQFVNARWYRWQVRAYDGKALSGWMAAATFHLDTLYGVNQPPQAPTLVSPADYDTLISLRVTLTAGPAYDPESAPLTYDFVLYGDAAHTQFIEAVQNIPGRGAGNSIPWAVSQTLSSGKGYFWTCRASDGVGYSPWAADRCFWAFDFSVNADQQTPENLKPRSGSTVKTLRPLLEVANVVSNLADNLYYFEISEDPTFINRIYSGPVEESSSGTTSWQVSVPLTSGQSYYWRSRANNSPYSEVFALRVQAEVVMAPNPYKSFKNDRQVKIYNMAADGVLTITTIRSDVVRVINGNASGLVLWDVTNSNGRALASDVYLCYYKDRDKAVNFKFAVIR